MHIRFGDDGEVDVHDVSEYDKYLHSINPFRGIVFHHTLFYSLINCASTSQSRFTI